MKAEELLAPPVGSGGNSGELEFTELVAVRHGLTDANAAGVLQGQFESNLVEAGIRQAERLAGRLARESFAAIYASDLSRALATARIVAAANGAPVIPDPVWREWHLGCLENVSYGEAGERYPELIDAFRYDADDILIPDGESKRAFYDRIGAALEAVAARHVRQRVLIVTHGGVLQAMLKHVLGGGNTWKFLPRAANTGYNKFVRRDRGWQLCCWNDTSHLVDS